MLQLNHVSKTYYNPDGSVVKAIDDISLSVEKNEFIAFVGPSGCGKTTLLKLIAGLERLTSGKIVFDNQTVEKPAKERGLVFQHYTSFPWLTVFENIAFGLRLNSKPENEIKRAVAYYLKLTGLEKFASTYPKNLSGGMQQRVAIARTIANNPEILLMDEPFGALDVQTRSKMQDFFSEILEKEPQTFIIVTHDVEEAIFLADTVYFLSKSFYLFFTCSKRFANPQNLLIGFDFRIIFLFIFFFILILQLFF